MQIQPGITNFTEESEIKKRYKELEAFNNVAHYLQRSCINLIVESHHIPKLDDDMHDVVCKAKQLLQSIHQLHENYYCR